MNLILLILILIEQHSIAVWEMKQHVLQLNEKDKTKAILKPGENWIQISQCESTGNYKLELRHSDVQTCDDNIHVHQINERNDSVSNDDQCNICIDVDEMSNIAVIKDHGISSDADGAAFRLFKRASTLTTNTLVDGGAAEKENDESHCFFYEIPRRRMRVLKSSDVVRLASEEFVYMEFEYQVYQSLTVVEKHTAAAHPRDNAAVLGRKSAGELKAVFMEDEGDDDTTNHRDNDTLNTVFLTANSNSDSDMDEEDEEDGGLTQKYIPGEDEDEDEDDVSIEEEGRNITSLPQTNVDRDDDDDSSATASLPDYNKDLIVDDNGDDYANDDDDDDGEITVVEEEDKNTVAGIERCDSTASAARVESSIETVCASNCSPKRELQKLVDPPLKDLKEEFVSDAKMTKMNADCGDPSNLNISGDIITRPDNLKSTNLKLLEKKSKPPTNKKSENKHDKDETCPSEPAVAMYIPSEAFPSASRATGSLLTSSDGNKQQLDGEHVVKPDEKVLSTNVAASVPISQPLTIAPVDVKNNDVDEHESNMSFGKTSVILSKIVVAEEAISSCPKDENIMPIREDQLNTSDKKPIGNNKNSAEGTTSSCVQRENLSCNGTVADAKHDDDDDERSGKQSCSTTNARSSDKSKCDDTSRSENKAVENRDLSFKAVPSYANKRREEVSDVGQNGTQDILVSLMEHETTPTPKSKRPKRRRVASPMTSPMPDSNGSYTILTPIMAESGSDRRSRQSSARSTRSAVASVVAPSATVLFTGVEVTGKHKKMVKNIGACLVESIDDAASATHVIAGDAKNSLRRTPKLMVALCVTSNILHLNWLNESFKAGEVLKCNKYLLLKDKAAEKKYDFSMKETIRNGNEARKMGGVLAGMCVYFCKGVAGKKAPSAKELEMIVQAAGGSYLKVLPREISNMKMMLIVTSDPATAAQKKERYIMKIVEGGGHLVSTTWLFQCMTAQKLAAFPVGKYDLEPSPKENTLAKKRKVVDGDKDQNKNLPRRKTRRR